DKQRSIHSHKTHAPDQTNYRPQWLHCNHDLACSNLPLFCLILEAIFMNFRGPQALDDKLPTYPIQTNSIPKPTSAWSWTAIQIATGNNNTYHCLRCSPEGRLLLKKQLLYLRFTIKAKNVDCRDQAEPSISD